MARIVAIEGERRRALSGGWRYAIDAGNEWLTPEAIPARTQWKPIAVPGTLAQTLIEEGAALDALPALDALHVWYETAFIADQPSDLVFNGLASLCDVFVDGALALSTDNMFCTWRIDDIAPGAHHLHLRFRAVDSEIEKKTGRARWRPRMIQPAGLRHIRTTALGRLPDFAPPTPPVGPYRDVEIVEHGPVVVTRADIRARVEGGAGRLVVELDVARPLPSPPPLRGRGGGFGALSRLRIGMSPDGAVRPLSREAGEGQGGGSAELQCGEHIAEFRHCERSEAIQSSARNDGEGESVTLRAELMIPDCALWFPHTHGAPALYPLSATIDGHRIDLGHTGFRDIDVARGADGGDFVVSVNRVPVFCRGAVWTGADVVSLDGSREAIAPLLEAMRDAGMNMVRVPGVTLYENDAFYALCDELGIMVWQDFTFANFDYPFDNAAFRESVAREASQFLSRTQSSPALVIACGGSEVYQQASMLGLKEEKWRSALFDDVLPVMTRALRPDIVYVENSPSGGALPFQSDFGVSHYYGVGAYRRALDDARRANVRFASECLGFSNVPEDVSLRRDFGEAPLSLPLWDARVPRDMGATQTFGDVTEHYIGAFYAEDPATLRVDNSARYLDLSRAVVAEAIETTIGEWRRVGSTTRGALVWFLKDMWPSPGWGLLDAHGEAKSAWFAMKRACRPVQVILTDEGVNGVFTHVINERAASLDASVTLTCYRDARTIVMRETRQVQLAPHSATMIRDAEFWGGFFDTALAYNFGAPSHDAVVAELRDAEGALIADAFLFPAGRLHNAQAASLHATIARDADGFVLCLGADAVTPFVKIDDESYRADDNWVHLAPGADKRIRLAPRDAKAPPRGVVTSLNGARAVYGEDE